MKTLVALQVLNEMLEGGELTESDISDLIKLDGESLYIDFKDGAELQNPKKAALTVRMYVSGFANADGDCW